MDVGRRAVAVLLVMAGVAAAYAVWHAYLRGDKAVIQQRFADLASEVNEGATEGLGLVTRAARIGSFFTDDVSLEPGDGSAPIQGRDSLMAMAARLQPGASSFTVAFEDVSVQLTGGTSADVSLTATMTRHPIGGSERSIDARELNVGMRKIGGKWLIAHVTAVEPLQKQ